MNVNPSSHLDSMVKMLIVIVIGGSQQICATTLISTRTDKKEYAISIQMYIEVLSQNGVDQACMDLCLVSLLPKAETVVVIAS